MGDIDRVKIPIDAPEVPADIGASDFTVELWLKPAPGENAAGNCSAGNDNWIVGNIFIDRDVYGAGDLGDYGLSLFANAVAFGVANQSSGTGICGAAVLSDGNWHHIAATRQAATGELRLYIDGALAGQGSGPTGNVSYADGRSTSYPSSDPFLVIGAEKHDAGQSYPSFAGWIDELRLSTVVRYSKAFSPQLVPFVSDDNTAALYHFDEGSSTTVGDSSAAPGGPSNGTRMVGGNPSGPLWSSDTPF